MKCKVCGGTGTSNTCVNGTFKPCTFCDGTGEYEPFDADIELDKLYPTEQTEQEYIQTCNTEQLAEWIAHQTMIALLENQNNHSLRMTYPAYWVEWLKKPHRGENEK